jgi:DNA-binding PadR family transcriptional regulator
MKLRPASYLMLGMVRLGARSGYAIKKVANVSTRFFWSTSLARVYPELVRAGGGGPAEAQRGPRRQRFAYELTKEGEAALREWMRPP